MQESEYHNIAALEDTHWWYTGMAAISAAWLRGLPGGEAHPRPILDAGCGVGGMLRWLERFGSPCGVDLHPTALRLAAARHKPRLAQADVRALPFAANSFGLVTSFDVLCQLPATGDLAALREFYRVLAPGGWLLLRLPAHPWLGSAHDRFVQTKHRYAKPELIAKLRGVGFHPRRLSYINGLLFLPALLWRLWRRHHPPASDVRAVSPPLNTLLRAALGAESAWLRHHNLPWGLSLLVLAQKQPA